MKGRIAKAATAARCLGVITYCVVVLALSGTTDAASGSPRLKPCQGRDGRRFQGPHMGAIVINRPPLSSARCVLEQFSLWRSAAGPAAAVPECRMGDECLRKPTRCGWASPCSAIMRIAGVLARSSSRAVGQPGRRTSERSPTARPPDRATARPTPCQFKPYSSAAAAPSWRRASCLKSTAEPTVAPVLSLLPSARLCSAPSSTSVV